MMESTGPGGKKKINLFGFFQKRRGKKLVYAVEVYAWLAHQVERVPHELRFSPCRSSRGFGSDLRPFAACHSPSLSLFMSKLSCQK